jgi:hypothetical protein
MERKYWSAKFAVYETKYNQKIIQRLTNKTIYKFLRFTKIWIYVKILLIAETMEIFAFKLILILKNILTFEKPLNNRNFSHNYSTVYNTILVLY